jgi:hypothetical protein
MSIKELRDEAERIRTAFVNAAEKGKDGKALAERYAELQRQIAALIATGQF